MVLHIPADFNARTQQLDVNETFIRDELNLQIENWARFRHTINIGNDASNLHSVQPVSGDIQEAYRELGKSHYEVITSLGCIKLSLEEIKKCPLLHRLQFKKSVKDFYFHSGCLLDNLARLIYIINDANSATATNRRGFIRHWVDWGSLNNYVGYTRLKSSRRVYPT